MLTRFLVRSMLLRLSKFIALNLILFASATAVKAEFYHPDTAFCADDDQRYCCRGNRKLLVSSNAYDLRGEDMAEYKDFRKDIVCTSWVNMAKQKEIFTTIFGLVTLKIIKKLQSSWWTDVLTDEGSMATVLFENDQGRSVTLISRQDAGFGIKRIKDQWKLF